jgi:hypothetical protein
MIGENYSYVTAFSKMDMLYAVDHAYKQGYEIDFSSPYTGTIGMSQIKVMLKPKDDGREKKIRAILLEILREKIPGLDNCLVKLDELNAKGAENAKSNGQVDVQTGGDDSGTETANSDNS